ncbi:MAG: 30S ribosomal protein S1 [Candidatus Altimarinota bacterium]
MTTKVKKEDAFLDSIPDFKLPSPGELVEGSVVEVFKNKILVDIDGIAVGLITGREAKDSAETMKTIKAGDTVSAYVIEGENEEGYIVLSLRKASQEKTWKNFSKAFEKDEVIEVVANEANKGGLLLDIDGIKGFIPVSQLAPMHYPRVNGADSNMILNRLQELVGLKFVVKIINIDKENGKLILSEKAAMEEQRQSSLSKLAVGNRVKGRISGVVKFGIFVAFDGLEGLVHISEIAWGHVKNPGDYGRLGDEVEVQIIGLEGDKISLSMKRLTDDPWLEAAKKYKIGTVIEGEVSRVTPFGAFVKLSDDINGLIHVSEITGDENGNAEGSLQVGEKIKAKVITIEPEEHRVGLSIKALNEDGEEKPKKKAAKKEDESEEDDDNEEKPKKAAKKTAKKKD